MNARKIPNKIKNILSSFYNFFLLNYYHVQRGKNFKTTGCLFCVANSRHGIVIGNDVSINSCRGSNPIGGDTKTTLFAKGNAKIKIGDKCGLSNVTLFSCESITIGDSVMLGGSVKIYDTDFHWLDFERRMSMAGGNAKPVVIEEGVFVGAHSIILKGVTIGKKSIIGAGSVVTKDVPAGEIWAGNPARFIRKVGEVES